ncbi:MAG: DUF3089 domain-containing protein [Rikenellaceae bacterium]
MRFLLRNALLLWVLAFVFGCSRSSGDDLGLDYSSGDLWYDLPSSIDYDVDVFYVLPTCIWDWTDSSGAVCHYADVYDASQREAMAGSYELAQTIFAQGKCNYFAPYYRQISLESWIEGDSVVNARFPFAMADIQCAFDQFMSQLNDGRPFVLAGFSQGGKAVVELLKGLSSDQYSRLVAAYVVGYRVSEDELAGYSTIVGAAGDSDTGVTICYNSVASPVSICSVLSPSALCINPLNWMSDSTPSIMNDTVSVSVDTQYNVLLVEGLDPELYYVPVLADLFPLGNYHLQELAFYQENLSSNVLQRINSFRGE